MSVMTSKKLKMEKKLKGPKMKKIKFTRTKKKKIIIYKDQKKNLFVSTNMSLKVMHISHFKYYVLQKKLQFSLITSK